MTRALKLGAQGLALVGVAGLLALLVWRVVHQNGNTAASQVAHGKSGPAPAFTLPRLTGVPETFFVDRRGRLVPIHLEGPVDLAANRDKWAEGIRLALRS